MKRWMKLLGALALLAVFGLLAWQLFPSREPMYQGKRLSQWLDAYNQAASLKQTEPISEAIRAFGTNSLPFLLAHIEHNRPPIEQKLWDFLFKHPALRRLFPIQLGDPYRSVSVLALRALGAQATPILPAVLRVAENPHTSFDGMMSFLAIGTNSIPWLRRACQDTNVNVRTQAIVMLAMMKAMPPPWFSWGWNRDPISGRRLFGLGYVVGNGDVSAMVELLHDPDPSVRRASAEALAHYARPPYTAVQSARPAVLELLHDPSPDVRKAARALLQKMDSSAGSSARSKTRGKL